MLNITKEMVFNSGMEAGRAYEKAIRFASTYDNLIETRSQYILLYAIVSHLEIALKHATQVGLDSKIIRDDLEIWMPRFLEADEIAKRNNFESFKMPSL